MKITATPASNAKATSGLRVVLFGSTANTDTQMTRQSLAADGIGDDCLVEIDRTAAAGVSVANKDEIIAYINAGDLWLPGKRKAILEAFASGNGPALLVHASYPAKPCGRRYKLEIHKSAQRHEAPFPASVCASHGLNPSTLLSAKSFPVRMTPPVDLPVIRLDAVYAALKDRRARAMLARGMGLLPRSPKKWKPVLSDFRDRFKGRRCFVLGNGPSLNQVDLCKLDGEIVLTSNRFHLHFSEISWRPAYHACIDAAVLPDMAGELHAVAKACPETYFFFPRSLGDDQLAQVRWYTPSIIPPAANLCFFEERSPPSPEQVSSLRPWRYLHRVPTVTGTLLQLAMLGGASSIYLVGCDTDYSPMPGAVPILPGYAGGTTRWQTLEGEDPNHFRPDYFGPGRLWREPRPEAMLAFYEGLRRQVDPTGTRIFNATVGGRLEAFPRVSFDDLFR